jgi:hypothetical protein
MHSRQGIKRLLAVTVLPSLLAGSLQSPTLAQDSEPASVAQRTPVDLASVPVSPESLPEPGYQLIQAGRLDLSALQYAMYGDAPLAESTFDSAEDEFTGAYSMILALHEDRGDPTTATLATVTTYVIGFDDPAATEQLAEEIANELNPNGGESLDGVDVFDTGIGTAGLSVAGDYLILVAYAFDEQQFSTQQNTNDWTPDAIASLVNETGDRLDDAIDRSTGNDFQPGTAVLTVVGEDALSSIPWVYYPISDHYRIRNGEILPYGGELSSDLEDVIPDGIQDLFVSRQQLGEDGYDHLIDTTLATFDSEDEAATFAETPPEMTFPPTWVFTVTYGEPEEIEPGVTLQTARADDGVIATGYRTVRTVGTTVQVTVWLASENALATEEGMLELTDLQSACVDASPEPCAFLPQEEFPAAVDADSAASGDWPEATPQASTGPNTVLAGLAHGWEVALPEDGWHISNVEFLNGTEYYELQSGRSLLTIESVIDRASGPDECILNEAGMLEELEERSVITLGSDDPKERKAGLEQEHAWAVYTVEPLQEERADQEYTIRIDCYTLVPGDVSLVVTHRAPRDLWIEERDKGERFRDGLTLPEPSSTVASATTPPAGDRRNTGRTIAMGTPRIWIPLAA